MQASQPGAQGALGVQTEKKKGKRGAGGVLGGAAYVPFSGQPIGFIALIAHALLAPGRLRGGRSPARP